METSICSCCSLSRPIAADLRMRPVRQANGWVTDTSRPLRRQRLCRECEQWLVHIVRSSRGGTRAPDHRLLGVPDSGGRALLFEDQCHLCHNMPGGTGGVVTVMALTDGIDSWPTLFLCPGCETWLGSLANDGRSARGGEERAIDGRYGEWPHPNLRGMRVHLDVRDGGALAAVAEACESMAIEIVAAPDVDTVVLVEAGLRGEAKTRLMNELPRRGRVLLATLQAREDLLASLDIGATAWLTIPLTPQQVTAALSLCLRQQPPRMDWDPETGLARAVIEGSGRVAVLCEPAPGSDRFELAWLLKRYSRGYDDVVLVDGEIVLLPRVRPEQVESVAARLESLLAGRCTLQPIAADERPQRRFEAAG